MKRRINEEHKLQDAFNDKEGCKKAHDTEQFYDWVGKQVFGPNASRGQEYDTPMYTNPTTCRIHESPGWERGGPRRQGESPVEYDADRAHEDVHSSHCRRAGPLRYNADMSFPCKLGADESAAYMASIGVMERWYDANCL